MGLSIAHPIAHTVVKKASSSRNGADIPVYPPCGMRFFDHILPEDITTFEGIPITTPARTLLDIATSISDEELMAAVATALDRGLTTRHEIRAVIARYPEHRGGPRLRALLRRGL